MGLGVKPPAQWSAQGLVAQGLVAQGLVAQGLAAVPATGYGGMAVRAIKKFSMAKLFSLKIYFLGPPRVFLFFFRR